MLTKKQKQVLDYIKTYREKRGYSPSLEEIRKHARVASVSTAHYYVQKLQNSGYLKKDEHHPRAIDVYENEVMVQIPLLGVIAAGQPIEAIENKETIAVSQSRLPLGKIEDVYALKVSGDSMVDENINDGDIVLVKQQAIAENGQKVVALIDNNETTLKTFYKERGDIRLQPANKKLEPIKIKNGEREFAVQGVVCDVVKNEGAILEIIPEKTLQKAHASIKKHLNSIYNGDIMDLLRKLPDNSIDTVFGDPDYNVGIKYNSKSYTRNFSEYIDWYIELTKEATRVLKTDGNLFMMNYPKQNSYLWVRYLDKYFPHISEYVWVYNTNVGHTPKRLTTAHRSILHVRKSGENKFYKDNIAVPYKNPTDKRILQNLKNGSKGRMPYSWFEHNLVKNVSREKTYHACQIPQRLSEMLIKATTKPDDIVLVLFGGSGAEVEVAKRLNRNFLTAEIDPKYCKIIGNRLQTGNIDARYKLGPRGKKRNDI